MLSLDDERKRNTFVNAYTEPDRALFTMTFTALLFLTHTSK